MPKSSTAKTTDSSLSKIDQNSTEPYFISSPPNFASTKYSVPPKFSPITNILFNFDMPEIISTTPMSEKAEESTSIAILPVTDSKTMNEMEMKNTIVRIDSKTEPISDSSTTEPILPLKHKSTVTDMTPSLTEGTKAPQTIPTIYPDVIILTTKKTF